MGTNEPYRLQQEIEMNDEDGSKAQDILRQSKEGGPGPDVMGAHTLIGNEVYNHKGEDIGEIKEIMLDMRTGKISYAVLSFGGFLGMGEKLFAAPWTALTLDTTNKRFVLNVEKERLVKSPGFNKDQWPDRADQSWSKKYHTYAGVEPDSQSNPV